MGGNSVLNPAGNNFLGGGSVGRVVGDVATGGLAEFARKDPWTGLVTNPNSSALNLIGVNPFKGIFGGDPNSAAMSGPFALDQAQFGADRSAINNLGEKQYQDTLNSINTNSASQSQYASDLLKRMTPDIEENLNAQHLLNSSALGGEIGKQASYLAQDVASQRANAIQQALAGKQGFETGALQRGLSLEDFVNQANVSKTIGAAFTPQAPTGKQNFGTVAQGVGALAPWASAFRGQSMVVPQGSTVQKAGK